MRIILFSLFISLFNLAYAQTNKIVIGTVTNQIKLGPMKGNKNLTLGLKNIAEEAILDKSDKLVLVDDAEPGTYTLNMEIVYFDIQQTSTGVSVFHKTDNETIIRIKGTLLLDGKKLKDYVATGTSSEISTSTMIIDEGGGFNQASARSALKKTIINLIDKLL